MSDRTLKLAKDLVVGDRIVLHVGTKTIQQSLVTVLAVVPFVQTIKRQVLHVTVRTEDGTELTRTMEEFRSVRTAT